MDNFRVNLQQTPLKRDSGSAGWPSPFWHLCLDPQHHPRSDEASPPPALNLYHSGKMTHETKSFIEKINIFISYSALSIHIN